MKIIRTEEGTFTRAITLDIDENVLKTINSDIEKSIVNGVKFIPLTLEDFRDILMNSITAPRAKEEYFIEHRFYTGNMKLGCLVQCEINEIFEELPGEVDEKIEGWTDKFWP